MIKAILCGASGKMGGFVALAATEDGEIQIVAGVDKINNGEKLVDADLMRKYGL